AVEAQRPVDPELRVVALRQRLVFGWRKAVEQRRIDRAFHCSHLRASWRAANEKAPHRPAGGLFNRSHPLARINVVASRPAQIPRDSLYREIAAFAQAVAGSAFTRAGRT